jgi:CheY-like chemotaxis protein
MSASTEATSGERPLVLVVDDDVILRRVVRSALAQAGFDVAQVGTGRDALSLASACEFDLVITDLEMPGMTGLELLHALRGQQRYCPVIVMSGSTDASADAMVAAGALAFLCKPFGLAELQSAARRAVERRRTIAPPSSVVLRRRVGNVA